MRELEVRPIMKIGFFHYPDGGDRSPVISLAAGLERVAASHVDLTDALVVLPEAFNIIGDYLSLSDPDQTIANDLANLSQSLGVAFVVGLIGQPSGRRRGYSYACLIDNTLCQVLSYKTDPDDSPNYEHCPFACDDVVLHRGTCIASLICHDAASNPSSMFGWEEKRARHQALLRLIQARSAGLPAMLCIPGRMTTVGSESVAEHWSQQTSNLAVVVANATASNASVARFGNRAYPHKHGNVVRLFSWADLAQSPV